MVPFLYSVSVMSFVADTKYLQGVRLPLPSPLPQGCLQHYSSGVVKNADHFSFDAISPVQLHR